MNRRDFLKAMALAGLGCALLPQGCRRQPAPSTRKKVLVLGIDGMDPRLLHHYAAQGLLPNFGRLLDRYGMRQMRSTIPPQSPVAWASFIVGAPPSVHGIYDFIHREPETLNPYLSIARVLPPKKTLELGDWSIPLAHGQVVNLRQGKPFWDYLTENDILATVFMAPTNFPCQDNRVRMTSGIGTPDLRGGYGNYTLFTTSPGQYKSKLTGGRVIGVRFENQRVSTWLPGPVNTLRKGAPEAGIGIEIWRDGQNPVVRLAIDGRELLLREGEWSGWIPVSFPLLRGVSAVAGIIKVHIKQVHPEFSMYVSPINIDPSDPALPVVSPPEYGRELVRDVGRFHTTGFPEDTKALSEGMLDDAEYLDLAYQILDERRRLLRHELGHLAAQPAGLLFFYFSSLDQNQHMFFRTTDPGHPMYTQEGARRFGATIQMLYVEMDGILGETLRQFDINDPNHTLIIMSDHGFVSFRRQVNVNTWLNQNGFLALQGPNDIESNGYFENVNWAKTAAYGLGINAIYLNRAERESAGTVLPAQAEQVANDIRRRLLNLVDPTTGEKAVLSVWVISDRERQRQRHAPDLIVGWNAGYRSSWQTILGGISREVFADNMDKWSGDHCVDPAIVPAALISNRGISVESPCLPDVTATILQEFSIPVPNQMTGKPLFGV